MYSAYCINTMYEYTRSIDLTNIDVINVLIDDYNQCFVFSHTDKTGEIHTMVGVIKSHNKNTNTLNMRVFSINQTEPNRIITYDKIVNISRLRDATILSRLTDTKSNGVAHANYEPRHGWD